MTISLYQQHEYYLGFLRGFLDVDLWLSASAAWSMTEGEWHEDNKSRLLKKVIEYCDSGYGFPYVTDMRKS
jgi:hypothetical protein